jgi:hypothetical protein
MVGFSGSYSHSAGDHFVFKGGVTWPSSVLMVTVGNSGGSGNPDYYGVSPTYYTGSSWSQPTFDGGANSSVVGFWLVNYNNITIDNFKFSNWGQQCVINAYSSTGLTIENCMFTNWVVSGSDAFFGVNGYALASFQGTISNCVFDGAPNNTPSSASGGAVYHWTGNIVNCIARHMSNGFIPNSGIVSGCQVGPIYLTISPSTVHENGIESEGSGTCYWFNNIVHDTIGMCLNADNGQTAYIYNNLIYNNSPIAIQCQGSGGTLYVYNNTVICPNGFVRSVNAGGGNIVCKNNHVIDGGIDTSTFNSVTTANNLTQTSAQASSAGYTSGNNWQPMSIGAPTVGTGANLASLGLFTNDLLGNSRPSSGAWDIGAYQYSGGPGTNPVVSISPTSLNFGAVVTNTATNLTLTVKNTGAGTLAGTATAAPPFQVVSGGTYSLSASQGQTVTIGYNPTTVGTNAQAVTFSGGGGATVTVTGSGVSGPMIAVTPTSLNFGAVVTNTASNLTLTVQNVGAGTLTGAATVAPPFQVVSGGTYSLSANQSQTVTISYNPTATGTNTQTVTFSGGGGATVSVTGTGTSSASVDPPSGASWYVDSAATGANNGTSWANAWTSFSKVVWGAGGVSAGGTLYISGGSVSQTYTASGDSMLTVGASGTSASNIVIAVGQDAGHNGKVIFNANGQTRAVNFNGQNYVTLDGRYNGAINLFMTNCSQLTFVGNNSFAVDVSNCNSPRVLGVDISTPAVGIQGIYGSGGEFAYNNLHDIREESGIRLVLRNQGTSSYDLTTVHNNTIQVNKLNASAGTGADGISGCNGMTVYSNVIYGAVGAMLANPNHQDLIQIQAHYVKIYANDFYNGADSLLDQDNGTAGFSYGGDLYIYNNTFRVTDGSGGMFFVRVYNSSGTISSVKNFFFDNNTVIDSAQRSAYGPALGFYNAVSTGSGTFVNSFIRNNIFYNCGSSANGYPVCYLAFVPTTGAGTFSTNGMVTGNNLVNAGSHGSTTLGFANPSGQSGAPTFVSYSAGSVANNLQLASTDTNAMDKGETLVYFSVDKNYVTRPQGTSWDIGAYEFAAGGSSRPVPPLPPQNVRVLAAQ